MTTKIRGILQKSRVYFEDSNISAIDLSGISYEKLPEIFTTFSEVKKVILRDSNLTGLPAEIKNLKNLTNLDLSSNQFVEIPKCLKELNRLRVLTIQNNNQESEKNFELTGFENVSQITKLDIGFNRYTKIPDSIRYLSKLEKLSMTNCGLVNIDIICNLSNLKEVYLRKNAIDSIPICISELQQLEILEISLNLKELLPPTFGNLPYLKKLVFYGCSSQITQLPDYISHLQNLEILELYNTDFSLPKTIGKLTKLKELKLEENKNIKTLPDDIGKCSSLQKIILRDTNIERLPDSLTQLQNLQYLDLSYNKIKQLPEHVEKWSKLEYLDLVYNHIEYLPETLGKLSKLKKLYLIDTEEGWVDKVVKALPRSIVDLEQLEGTDLYRLFKDEEVPWMQEFIKAILKKHNMTDITSK